jgi:hypothetical protein
MPAVRSPAQRLTKSSACWRDWLQGVELPPNADGPSGSQRGLRDIEVVAHTKIESTVRYLGIEFDDAIEIAERIDV